MNKFKDITISLNQMILDAIAKMTANRKQFVIVVDDTMRLLGMVTDGDIRRGILRGLSTDDSIKKIMNPHPITATINDIREDIIKKMRENQIRHCPIVDSKNKLLGVEFLEDFLKEPQFENWVIIIAGGLGERLHPLTFGKPKPLIELQGKPILVNIIRDLRTHGFHNIYLSINYKGEMIERYFQNGDALGVSIKYIKESARMGTAGSLSLLEELPKNPIIVMNCDLVTNINYTGLMHFHKDQRSVATMCVKEYDFEIPYGVVKTDNYKIIDIQEKPVRKFYINAGIYVLQPEIIQYIPKNKFYDMPQLFQQLIEKDLSVHSFPILEKWIDIGSLDDLERVNGSND